MTPLVYSRKGVRVKLPLMTCSVVGLLAAAVLLVEPATQDGVHCPLGTAET